MSLDLYVDGSRWRTHLRRTTERFPGVIPVAKGNGYGFGLASLARRTQWLGCDTIAVGTYREVADVSDRFAGDIMVLEPWRPFSADASYGRRIIHTVGRIDDLTALAGRDDRPRVLLEGRTSMNRHGFTKDQLRSVAEHPRGVRLEGGALHLPLGSGHVDEVETWLSVRRSSTWLVSHLDADELAALAERHPGIGLRPRIGTALWLGDRAALAPKATVLDAHPVERGDRVGYRQRRMTKDGTVLVVSGGTAHGIGLESATSDLSPRQRAKALAAGGLDAAGRARSPYLVAGKQRWFVEPPHMQVSLIFVPNGVVVPAIGDLLDVRVRFTITHFDHIHLS